MRLFITCVLLLWSVTITYAQQSERVVYLPLRYDVPQGAVKVGSLKLGDNSISSTCDYQELVNAAKQRAIALGGNMVKVTAVIAPAFISKCYTIKVDVYKATDISSYPTEDVAPAPPQRQDYALLCIYRLPDTTAFATSYKVHLNGDSVLCTVKKKSRDSVKIYADGPLTLWASTETRKELHVDVKKGNTYYIRCGLVMGELRMVPVLELVGNEQGAKEYGPGAKNNQYGELHYLQQVH